MMVIVIIVKLKSIVIEMVIFKLMIAILFSMV